MADHIMTIERDGEQPQQEQQQRRLGEQEDAIFERLKDFLKSSLTWSLALMQARDLFVNKQATFIVIFVAVIALFGINSQTMRRNRRTMIIGFVFFILGCLVVGIAIDSIVLNFYCKWVIYGIFLAMIATNPDHQQFFLEMKRVFKSMHRGTSLRLKNLFIQSRVIIENLFTIDVADREQSSMSNNSAT